MLGPGFVPIAKELGITVVILSESTAWLILTLGLCVFFFNPAAKIWGKRPIYVFCSIVLFVVSIWACRMQSGWLVARADEGTGRTRRQLQLLLGLSCTRSARHGPVRGSSAIHHRRSLLCASASYPLGRVELVPALRHLWCWICLRLHYRVSWLQVDFRYLRYSLRRLRRGHHLLRT